MIIMTSIKRLTGFLFIVFLFEFTLNGAVGVSLVDAIKKSDAAAVRTLIAQNANVNATEVDGTTPLHWAAHLENIDAANQLVRAGADVNAQNRYGVTPLSEACINGNAAMIEL